MSANKGSHALVVGSSVAGMLAAWVLSQHFDRVTIVERDQLPDEAAYRNGVPQARHLHLLLARGHQALSQLFPNFAGDLKALGVSTIDIGSDAAFRTAGGWTKRTRSGIITNPVSRITVDYYLRQQLKTRGNIDFLPQTEVRNYILSEDRLRVTGVEVSSRAEHTSQSLQADLIVDASGRSSNTPQFLEAFGFPVPSQTVVNSYLGYATRWYKLPPGQHYDWCIMAVGLIASEAKLSGGAAQVVEGDRLVLTLVGANKNYPPTDEADFMEFLRNLPSPALYETVKDLEPDSPIYGYRRTENVWNHYERLPRFPDDLLVMGDAYCGFNPIYGQGMTVAAMEAQQLDRVLGQRGGDLNGLPQVWFKTLSELVQTPWLLATGEDLRFPGTEGDRPGLAARLAQKYVDQLIRFAPLDTDLGIAVAKVTQLVEPPLSMFQPRIVARLLVYRLRGAKVDDNLNLPQTQLRPAAGD